MISNRSMSALARSRYTFQLGLSKRITSIRPLSFKGFFERFKLIPQPPGNIVGTVNDPADRPEVSFYEGSYHWTYERIITICMVPLSVSCFSGGVENPIIDAVLSVLLLFHCHAGFKSCIIDYIPLRVYGIWHKISSGLLTFGTVLGIYGIYLIETTSNGLTDLIKSIWSV